MIKIPLDFAVAIYITLSLIIFILWIIFEYKGIPKISSMKDTLWECPICFYIYIDSKSDTISECPRCKTLNKKEKNG